MKQFFENYGAVALGILALLVLVAMITPVGNIIKTSLQGTVQTFSTKIDDQTDTMTESVNAAFTNAIDFSGVRDGKLYQHGSILEQMKNFTINPDGTVTNDTTGYTFTPRYDVNATVNGIRRPGGFNDFLFDIYLNNTLVESNTPDSVALVNLNELDSIKVVIKKTPEGTKPTQQEYIVTYENIYFDGGDNSRISIEIVAMPA